MKEKLNSKKILKEIEKNKENIKKKGVKKIGLFGSFLKRKQKPKSDIDILIEFKEVNADNFFDILFLLKKMFKRNIDLVIESDLKPELKYVKKEAQYVRM